VLKKVASSLFIFELAGHKYIRPSWGAMKAGGLLGCGFLALLDERE
jgi:hypothetical protein